MVDIGLVMKTLAIYPLQMLPWVADRPIAYAVFMVVAFITSSGSIRNLMQPNDIMNFISPDGHEPGL